jgi:hypothetical protein
MPEKATILNSCFFYRKANSRPHLKRINKQQSSILFKCYEFLLAIAWTPGFSGMEKNQELSPWELTNTLPYWQ